MSVSSLDPRIYQQSLNQLTMKILIRLPNWLGDVVMSTAFVNAVGQFYNGAQVDVIIKKELAGVAAFIPGINKVYPFSKQEHNGLTGVYRFGRSLRGEDYDLYFNLPNSFSSYTMAWAAKARKRIGFSKEGGMFLLTHAYNKPVNKHRVDEYLYLLEKFTGKTIQTKQVILQAGDADKNDTVIVNFNSEASSRRMPADKGRSILQALINTFKDVNFALIGAPKEVTYVDQVIAGLDTQDRVQNLAGKTDLPALAKLMAGSRVVLTTDSGPAHMANSVGAPTVVLFGPGNEYNTAPYNQQKLTVMRYGQLNCEPCVRNTCKLYGIPKCMDMLEEIRIINALSLYINHA
jgi:heptosyltransferase-2